jgi:hypothetical protein
MPAGAHWTRTACGHPAWPWPKRPQRRGNWRLTENEEGAQPWGKWFMTYKLHTTTSVSSRGGRKVGSHRWGGRGGGKWWCRRRKMAWGRCEVFWLASIAAQGGGGHEAMPRPSHQRWAVQKRELTIEQRRGGEKMRHGGQSSWPRAMQARANGPAGQWGSLGGRNHSTVGCISG